MTRILFVPLLLALGGPASAVAWVVIEHERPAFTLLLQGEWLREAESPPGVALALRSYGGAEADALRISVDVLGGLLGRGPLDEEEAASRLREVIPGAAVSFERARWRDEEIDVVVTRAPAPAGFVTLSARLPLAERAIQLNAGGPAAREPEVRTLLAAALAGLKGEVRYSGDGPGAARWVAALALGGIAVLGGILCIRRRTR